MTTRNRAFPLSNGDQDHKYAHIILSYICNKAHAYERCKFNRGCIHLHVGRPDIAPPHKSDPSRGKFPIHPPIQEVARPILILKIDNSCLFPSWKGGIEKRSGIGNKIQLSPLGDIPPDGGIMNANIPQNNNKHIKYRIESTKWGYDHIASRPTNFPRHSLFTTRSAARCPRMQI